MSHWPAELAEAARREAPFVLITLAATRGSVPREAGTRMIVFAGEAIGTIGGGHLEFSAISTARAMLENGKPGTCRLERLILGASLGQCCGGAVQLLFERVDASLQAWLFRLAEALQANDDVVAVTGIPLASGDSSSALRLLVSRRACIGVWFDGQESCGGCQGEKGASGESVDGEDSGGASSGGESSGWDGSSAESSDGDSLDGKSLDGDSSDVEGSGVASSDEEGSGGASSYGKGSGGERPGWVGSSAESSGGKSSGWDGSSAESSSAESSGGASLAGIGSGGKSLGPESLSAIMARARAMLENPAQAPVCFEPPLLFHRVEPVALHIALFGAGHVGRAIIGVLGLLPCRVTWIDAREAEFRALGPAACPGNVSIEISDQVDRDVDSLPGGTVVLVMTHDHALDEAICARALRRDDLHWCGLIGSRGKRHRFEQRLLARGLSPDAVARLRCPIGIDGIDGNHPGEIAVSVCAEILKI